MNDASRSSVRMLPTDRIAYSAIAERPALKLPDGARMAVWVIVNVEEWNPERECQKFCVKSFCEG
jgi:hypothetical protein